jgi:YrbI family 3-deoxy-D-manno-octulosonate 8-phosphate phosphatase
MTDNRVWVNEDGIESVAVNRGDGMGVSMIRKRGIPQIILSTERNRVVQARADKLQIPAIQGSDNKEHDLAVYCLKHSVDLSRVLYVGNDINDLAVMQTVGFRVAPADAVSEILAIADYVTKSVGGGGVVREIALSLV